MKKYRSLMTSIPRWGGLLTGLFMLAGTIAWSPAVAWGQASNCEPPNLMMILDRSCSMGYTGTSYVNSGRTCSSTSQCNPMQRTYQPTPGYTPRYSYTCSSATCMYTRWDTAVNALKEVAYQYGGTSGAGYADRKIRLGLTLFSDSATITNAVVANPPQLSTSLSNYSASGGTYYVPAFQAARTHLQSVVNADSVKNRPTHIMFITDGDSSDACSSSVTIARDLFNGTGANRLVDNLGNVYKVKTYVIGFGTGLSTTGKNCLRDIAVAGGTQRCDPSIAGCVAYYASDNNTQLQNAMNAIINNATQEVCDGIDNDCDGTIDNGIAGTGVNCNTGQQGVCSAGKTQCTGGGGIQCVRTTNPTAEICDGKDNNCNGSVDEGNPGGGGSCNTGQQGICSTGTRQCQNGALVCIRTNPPAAETCNGQDDDCDGKTDEGNPGGGGSCTTGQPGICTPGTRQCQSGSLVCVRTTNPVAEKCNGIDDDCDGKTDEAFTNLGQACNAGQGACGNTGQYICNAAGTGTECSVKSGVPSPESCNGQDDDCDGKTDEGNPGGGGNCSTGQQGICDAGTRQCQSGTLRCVRNTAPSAEKCNGQDDDCDGKTDEGNPDGGANCNTGQQGVCSAGKQECQGGSLVCVRSTAPSAEKCNGLDDNCDGSVDEGNPDGGASCNTTEPGLCRPGTQQCRNGKLQCIRITNPAVEECDGLDNDCDGKVDEDFANKGQACKGGIGACERPGKYVCTPDKKGTTCDAVAGNPTPEDCDGIDNDCNGQIDDGISRSCKTDCESGVELCQNGSWLPCSAKQPQTEVCNNQDDDCNGQIDDKLTQPCSSPCGTGTEECRAGKWVFCTAPKPEAEVCDGKDNDCNGQIDDGIPDKPCSGACGQGKASCVNGQFSGCSGPQPEPEVCDGKDNDCNGQIDDKLIRTCKSACGEGEEICRNGQWSACNAPLPQTEICNGLDDDCDGQTDNNATCPTSETCIQGACRRTCRNGECPRGQQCRDGFCYGCDNVTCPSDKKCQEGICVDACLGVTCPTGEACKNGKCVEDNCYGLGCPNGQICQNGQCTSDPCKGVSCQVGQFCKQGQCIDICDPTTCTSSQSCGSNGQCVDDPCKGVSCDPGKVCDSTGKCVGDPCSGVTCPEGRACKDGKCEDDPCLGVSCPGQSRCVNGICVKDPNPGEPGSEQTGSENPQGETNNPDGITDGSPNPDEPTSNKETDPNNETGGNSEQGNNPGNEKVIGGNSPDGQGSDRYQTPGGCGCQGQSPLSFSFLLFVLFLLPLVRRRRERA
ncbi:MAG: VWA domain-containing protein [Myxococcales bacterium]|nr:VWA domain-containing protein [Myxococcales bacterium]MCB9643049.1 VWA domain-containing protein [Myxococcales bacterium]